MKVAFNVYPLQSAHKGRGIGYYTQNLLDQFRKKDDLQIIEFTDTNQVKDADVVHYPWFDLFFRTLKLSKYPMVVTVYDTTPLIFPQEYPVGFKGKINFYFQKRSLKNCQRVITISLCSKKDIVKYLDIPEDKIKVIPLAANGAFRPLSDAEKLFIKRKYNLPNHFLLYVGDANYVKNLHFLIMGFKALKENFPDLKLILAGGVFLKKPQSIDHPELKSLKNIFQKIDQFKLENEILRPGQISTEDLVGFYNLATVYVQPSLYEGFGLPVVEAFACGTPVVASNTSSLTEVSGNAALYFDPRNITQFREVLTQLLQDKSLQDRFSRLGLKRAQLFSWEKTANQTVKVYEEISRK